MWAWRVQKANAKKYLRCQKLTTVCLVESVCSRVTELKGKCQRGEERERERQEEVGRERGESGQECWELRTFLAAARSGNLTLSFALAKWQVAAAALSLPHFLPAECAPAALSPRSARNISLLFNGPAGSQLCSPLAS